MKKTDARTVPVIHLPPYELVWGSKHRVLVLVSQAAFRGSEVEKKEAGFYIDYQVASREFWRLDS